MQTIALYLCYIVLILLFSTAYNTSLIYCFVIWCLHTNKRRPCSSTLSGHPSSSCYLSSEAPVCSKVVFSLARSVCPKLHDFSQLFGQGWHGCPNCFATRSPKHTILVFSYCHLHVCLWYGEKQAMSFQDCATNERHIVCQNLLVACQKFREHVRSVSEVPRRC